MHSGTLATALVLAFAAPAWISWSCAGELPGPAVCSGAQGCPEGYGCVLGRCRKDKTMPVSLHATRLEIAPEDIAWVGAEPARSFHELGDKIVLGRRGENEMLLLRFALALPEERRLQRALLELDALPGCDQRPGSIAFELAQVLSPWSSRQVARGRSPELSLPMLASKTSATPSRPLMIDVTELVGQWQAHPKRYHGIALLASGQSATGACYASGVSWGRGPRLSVFLWPEKKDAGADSAADSSSSDAGGDAASSAQKLKTGEESGAP